MLKIPAFNLDTLINSKIKLNIKAIDNNGNSYPLKQDGFSDSSNYKALYDTFVTLDELNNIQTSNPTAHLKNIYFIKFPAFRKVLYVTPAYQLVAREWDTNLNSDMNAMWIFIKDSNTNAYAIINVGTSRALTTKNSSNLYLPSRDAQKDVTDWFFISKNFSMNSTLLCSNSLLNFLYSGSGTNAVSQFSDLIIDEQTNLAYDRFKISIEQAPINPGDLYLPLIFCCGDYPITTKLGSLIQNTDTNQKSNICSFMNLNASNQTDYGMANNCNNTIANICTKKFPPKNKPILDESDPDFKEWSEQSTSESKMCHCVVDTSYYRTQYKQELTTQYKAIADDPVYKKYYNFLVSQIDNLVYKRYPLSSSDRDKYGIPSNPFGNDRDTDIPSRCFDDTCRNGFKPIKDDNSLTVNFPYYTSIYQDNQKCGTSSANVNCNQFVFNLIDNSRVGLNTDQSQSCGNRSGFGNKDLTILIKPEDPFICNTINNGIQTFYCPLSDLETCKQLYITTYNQPTSISVTQNPSKSFQKDGKNYTAYDAKGVSCVPMVSPTTIPSITTNPPTAIPTVLPTPSNTISPTPNVVLPTSPSSTTQPVSPTTNPVSSTNTLLSNQTVLIIGIIIIIILISAIIKYL